jgi:hypothetical protein
MIFLLNVCCFEKALSSHSCKILSTVHEILKAHGVLSKKPTTRHKSLTNFITQCSIEYTSPCTGIESTTLVVTGTDCTGSCKSNYHTITTKTAPELIGKTSQIRQIKVVNEKKYNNLLIRTYSIEV